MTDSATEQTTQSIQTKQVGRPTKDKLLSKTKRNRKKVGRPAGEAKALNDFKARLLASPKSRKVIDSILAAALDDDHKNQAAAWKLVMDRIAPVSSFDKEANKGPGGIQIKIEVVGEAANVTAQPIEEPIDGDFEQVEG